MPILIFIDVKKCAHFHTVNCFLGLAAFGSLWTTVTFLSLTKLKATVGSSSPSCAHACTLAAQSAGETKLGSEKSRLKYAESSIKCRQTHWYTRKINEGASETIRLGQDRVIDREQAGEWEEERRERKQIYILAIQMASSLSLTFGLSLIINTRCKWRPFTFSLIWNTLHLCGCVCGCVTERVFVYVEEAHWHGIDLIWRWSFVTPFPTPHTLCHSRNTQSKREFQSSA